MLVQEDLGEMGLSSPSEQVAYLLVERATLLERLEATERRLESQSLTDISKEAQQQVKDSPVYTGGCVGSYLGVVHFHHFNCKCRDRPICLFFSGPIQIHVRGDQGDQ